MTTRRLTHANKEKKGGKVAKKKNSGDTGQKSTRPTTTKKKKRETNTHIHTQVHYSGLIEC